MTETEPRTTGIDLIAAERLRQVESEHWSADHDDTHVNEEMAWAAVCYAAPAEVTASAITLTGQWGCNCRSSGECGCPSYDKVFTDHPDPWPWDYEWDKREQHDRIRQLTIAGALIAAEIDRLQRAEINGAVPQIQPMPYPLDDDEPAPETPTG